MVVVVLLLLPLLLRGRCVCLAHWAADGGSTGGSGHLCGGYGGDDND
jgi:hypothetical protein